MNQLREVVAEDAVAGPFAGGAAETATIYARGGKRLFDLLLCLMILPIVAPVIAVFWLLVRRDGGRGFYGHTRIGKGGQVFHCWKLRSMVPDADAVLARHLEKDAAAKTHWNDHQKLSHDPRVTRLGHFLRKTSLDELPQIWNVLIGQMSLVGPRPVTQAELDRYGIDKRSYLRVLPGITGLWQVSGRNTVSYRRRVALDVRYVQSMSLAQDVRILARTVKAVTNGTGS